MIVGGLYSDFNDHRSNCLGRVIDSIINQVDKLYVYLKNYKVVPHYLRNEKIVVTIGDLDKSAAWLNVKDNTNSYWFSFSDFTVYPKNYVQVIVRRLNHYNNKVIIGISGSVFCSPFIGYNRSRKIYAHNRYQNDDVSVNILDSIHVAFHSDSFSFCNTDIKHGSADFWLAMQAKLQNIGLVVIAHPANWISVVSPFINGDNVNDWQMTGLVRQLIDFGKNPEPVDRSSLIEGNNFSVIMTVFNTKSEFIKESFGSLISQTLPAKEIIIIDDGSTDINTIKCLDELSKKSPVKFIRFKENKGIAFSINAALRVSKYDIIAIQDSDDISSNDRFEKQFNYLKNNSTVDCLGGQLSYFGNRNNYVSNLPAIVTKENATNWFISHPTIMFKKSAIKKIGGYENYQVACDYNLFMKMVVNGLVIHNLPDIILRYRVHENNNSCDRNGIVKNIDFSEAKNNAINGIRKPFQNELVSPSCDLSQTKVVIGVSFYGRPDLTKRFMESISKCTGIDKNNKSYELSPSIALYLTEDGSPTQEGNLEIINAFKGSANYRLFTNEKNLGFIKSQNSMMEKAMKSGADIYVSINSDTHFPDKEWIIKVLTFMFTYRVHVCAPAIREPNNYLCDTRVGFAHNEIDNGGFVNGACMFISKNVINDIGYFDEVYKDGYFDDPDFCFRAACAAYKLEVAKDVEINHDSGATFKSSPELLEKRKQLFNENRKIGVSRWGNEKQAKVVLKCTWNLCDDECSGTTGMYYFAKFLSYYSNLSLFPSEPTIWNKRYEKPDICLRNFKIINDPSNDVLEIKPDLIVFGWWSAQGNMVNVAKKINSKLCVYTGDIHYVRERMLNLSNWQQRMQQELELYRKVDALTVVSEMDKLNLPEDIQEKTFIIPHQQSKCSILPTKPNKKIIGYLSNWQHHPNVTGMRWFINNVWEKVLQLDSEIKLYLFGYDPTEYYVSEFTKKKNVFFHGFVETMNDIFGNVDITIAPLVDGAGMNGKVIDSVNYQTPCVMVDRVGKAFDMKTLATDDPNLQAKMIVDLLNNKKYYDESTRQQGIEMQASYGYDLFYNNMKELFEFLKLPFNGVK